jgi:hypothetical protein
LTAHFQIASHVLLNNWKRTTGLFIFLTLFFRISFPEDFKVKNGDKEIRCVKFFSQDFSIMCPFIAEIVQNEFLLVFYINISAAEQSLTGETIGSVQIVEPSIAEQTSVKCLRTRVLISGCDAKIPAKKTKEIEIR